MSVNVLPQDESRLMWMLMIDKVYVSAGTKCKVRATRTFKQISQVCKQHGASHGRIRLGMSMLVATESLGRRERDDEVTKEELGTLEARRICGSKGLKKHTPTGSCSACRSTGLTYFGDYARGDWLNLGPKHLNRFDP
jgi:hypothetical protein